MSLKPDIFDRDRPWHWNALGLLAPNSRFGVGNEWKHAEEDDGTLVCEECGYPSGERPVMIVNRPFDPETPVDFDSPTQVLCDSCTRDSLPMDSDYRFDKVKGGSTVDLDPENLEGIPT